MEPIAHVVVEVSRGRALIICAWVGWLGCTAGPASTFVPSPPADLAHGPPNGLDAPEEVAAVYLVHRDHVQLVDVAPHLRHVLRPYVGIPLRTPRDVALDVHRTIQTSIDDRSRPSGGPHGLEIWAVPDARTGEVARFADHNAPIEVPADRRVAWQTATGVRPAALLYATWPDTPLRYAFSRFLGDGYPLLYLDDAHAWVCHQASLEDPRRCRRAQTNESLVSYTRLGVCVREDEPWQHVLNRISATSVKVTQLVLLFGCGREPPLP